MRCVRCVAGCHTFALSKPLSGAPGRLRLVAAVGRRLLLFVWRNVIARPSALAEWNEFRQSQVDSSFQFARVRASPRRLLPTREALYCTLYSTT